MFFSWCAHPPQSAHPHLCTPVDAQVGDVVVGTVQSVKPYGAFVDIGGVNGLLHISQISEERVSNVEAVLSEGDKLKVRLIILGSRKLAKEGSRAGWQGAWLRGGEH